VVVCCRKNTLGRSRNGGGGEEGWVPSHKLNINNGLTDEIIPIVTSSAILLVEMPHHHKICLLESHYNTLHNVIGIYWWKFSRMNFTVGLIMSVRSSVKLTYHCTVWIFLFIPFPLRFPRYIPWEYSYWCLPMDLRWKIRSVNAPQYTDEIFLSMFLLVFVNFW
jgi:hypothetical protein